MTQPTSLREAFELAWQRTSTDQIPKEAAMNWFYEGIAALKQSQPTVRLADAYNFAQQRNASINGYRAGDDITSSHVRFFYKFIRAYNDDKKIDLTPTEAEAEHGIQQLIKMEKGGLQLSDWLITNYVLGRYARYADYPGFSSFRQLIESLHHRALK